MSGQKHSEELEEISLYAEREKIYPRQVHGTFAILRVIGVLSLLGLYYFIPWLQWDGHQAILFDIPARKFYILGLIFWPQDFIYLALLLVLAALSLFFFTALAGRLWCGYACPQTVWTEVFLWIERKVEGTRNQQIKRDKQGWSAEKIRVKTIKHFIWITFSLYTGITFVGYFTPIRELGDLILQLSLGPWEWFWILFYSFATYGNAGWLREQVCIYMCPYARFQSAMVDDDTLIISYNEKRGDPRGSRRKDSNQEEQGLGACIDCSLCVQVCPTGIDIRDGLQYECIACAACIDVCDEVMDKMDYPKGLISYTTLNTLEGKKPHILRPRIVIYIILLIALTSGIFYSMLTRAPLSLDIIRDRNTLFRETNEGLIENVYKIQIINKDTQAHYYQLRASGIDGLQVKMDIQDIYIDSGQNSEIVVRLQADPENLKNRSSDVTFMLNTKKGDISIEEEARFIGPMFR
jgi:cytochrome c oxidase accessory protein FixG